MTQEEFKKQIERPIDKLATPDISNAKEFEMLFWRKIELSATISRTLRLCLEHPDLAKEYLDSLPKTTMD